MSGPGVKAGAREHPEGYEYDFLQTPRDELNCPICMMVAREAVVTEECGHLFCEACLAETVKRVNDCPVCRMKIDDDNTVRRDVRARREISNLKICCTNKKCKWTGCLGDIDTHLQSACLHEMVQCPEPYCGFPTERKDLAGHKCRQVKSTEAEKQQMKTSVITIQKVVRGFIARRRVKYLLSQQELMLSYQNRQFRRMMIQTPILIQGQPQDLRRSHDFELQREGNLRPMTLPGGGMPVGSQSRRASTAQLPAPPPPPYQPEESWAQGEPREVDHVNRVHTAGEIEEDMDETVDLEESLEGTAWSAPGHGQSPEIPIPWTQGDQVEDIVELFSNPGSVTDRYLDLEDQVTHDDLAHTEVTDPNDVTDCISEWSDMEECNTTYNCTTNEDRKLPGKQSSEVEWDQDAIDDTIDDEICGYQHLESTSGNANNAVLGYSIRDDELRGLLMDVIEEMDS